MCVQSNGNVNIGNSQNKSTFFNVQGDSNFEGHCNLTSNKLYKINGLQIDSNDILYDNSGTELLKTKIDSKQNNLTFGKLINNVPFFEEDITTNDVIVMGSTNLMGITYSQLKGSLSLNLVNNTSDLNKPVSTATSTELGLKQNNLTFGKSNGNALKLEETLLTNDVLIMGSSDVIGKTYSELKALLQITDTTYSSGTNITIDTNNAINLNTTIVGNITFNNDVTIDQDLTIKGSFNGQINPYITTSQADYDQPIVAYLASGVVPSPPSNLALIIPKTNIITVNSSTGLLKSESIQVTGSITNATNITSTTAITTATMYTSALNSSIINTSTLNAGANIDCERITGGTNNGASNFHIDCISGAGEMFLNYYNNNNLRLGNVPATSLSGGGRFTIFSNISMPIRLHNNCASAFTTGWTASLQQDSIFDGATMIQGFYKNLSTTKYTHTIGYSSNTSGGTSPVWLNCYHGDTVDWTTSNYKFCPVCGDTITRRIFCGVRPQMGLTSGLSNSAKVIIGRSTSQDYGIRLGGWNNGTVEASHHIIQASLNLHLDASSSGDIYMNLYGSASPYNKKCSTTIIRSACWSCNRPFRTAG